MNRLGFVRMHFAVNLSFSPYRARVVNIITCVGTVTSTSIFNRQGWPRAYYKDWVVGVSPVEATRQLGVHGSKRMPRMQDCKMQDHGRYAGHVAYYTRSTVFCWFPNLIFVIVSTELMSVWQGCGLSLDISVSRRSRGVSMSRLGLVSTKIVNVSVSSRSRPLTSRARDQFSAKFCRSQ